MRYELIVRAFDVMDQVYVTVSLKDQEDSLAVEPEWQRLASEQFRGRGESDPRKWAIDALMWAAESL